MIYVMKSYVGCFHSNYINIDDLSCDEKILFDIIS